MKLPVELLAIVLIMSGSVNSVLADNPAVRMIQNSSDKRRVEVVLKI